MDIKMLQTFMKVSELHSFSRAAEVLGYTQSAVSLQIARIEEEFGAKLFDRIGHNIMLNEKGYRFLEYAQGVTMLTESIQEDFAENETISGTLKIAMADSLCSAFMGKYLPLYRELYPAVNVQIRTGVTGEMFNWLSHNEVDMIYTLDERINRSNFTIMQEERVPVAFCVAKKHPILNEKEILWEDIEKYPLYLTEGGISYRRILERKLENSGISLTPAVEMGDTEVILQLLEKTDGIGFLPTFAIDRYNAEQSIIKKVNVKGISIDVWKQLIYYRGKSITRAMEGMIELIHNDKSLNKL